MRPQDRFEETLGGPWRGRDAPAGVASAMPHLEAALHVDPRPALARSRNSTVAAQAGDAMRRHARRAFDRAAGVSARPCLRLVATRRRRLHGAAFSAGAGMPTTRSCSMP
jgi:hypothetical protein